MSAPKFTPEARGGLLERTAAGASLADACRAVGLREATVKGWLTRGRRETAGEYAEFVRALDAAREAFAERPEPMSREEFGRHVDRAVRAGSVAAMKLWAELNRQGDEPAAAGPLSKIDELAAKRAAA